MRDGMPGALCIAHAFDGKAAAGKWAQGWVGSDCDSGHTAKRSRQPKELQLQQQ
jgi:hypothetical protein